MKLDNFGIFVISNLVMRKMSVMDLVEMFRFEPGGWEREQTIRLQWLKKNQPEYYELVKGGDIDACALYGMSSNLADSNIVENIRSSIWVNGSRIGSIEYHQTREFKKFTATFYRTKTAIPGTNSLLDPEPGINIFLLEYPQFKNNMGRYTWIRRN